jgi:hypothetical protein
MFTAFPFLPYLAAVVGAVLLAVRWTAEDASPLARAVLLAWFVVAAYCQFFGGSAVLSAAGLALQTALAVYLLIWWRVNG